VMDMRIAAAIFVAAHGVGYSIWFMSAWMPAAMGTSSRTLTFPTRAPATGGVGKLWGLLALAVLAGFLVSGWGIWQQAGWWPGVLIASSVASLPVGFAMWNPVGIVSVPATMASLALIAATLMPWGDRFFGSH
jgi:hypothetical protein